MDPLPAASIAAPAASLAPSPSHATSGFVCPDDAREPPLTVEQLADPYPKAKPASSASTGSAKPSKPAAVVKMTEHGTVIYGSLDPQIVKSTIRRRFPQLRKCYEASLARDASSSGTVTTELLIDSTGRTKFANSHTAGTDIGDEEMIACIERTFACLGYPAPAKGKVLVRYPIRFEYESL